MYINPKNIADYIKVSEGFSIAHLRELVILTQCFRMPLKNAADRLQATMRNKPASDHAPDRPALGFATGSR